MKNDIDGVERWVIGFSKIPDEDGEYPSEVMHILQGISLKDLQNIFNVDLSSSDLIIIDMIYPLDINIIQASYLNNFITNGAIDIELYNYELHCYQAPGSNWSKR